jgi:signal transduction histidine kinase
VTETSQDGVDARLAALAEEQAALRRVATLVARDVQPREIFAAVSEEVARLFKSVAGVLRFELGSGIVWVGVANVEIPIGTQWEFEEGMTAAEVYRTGRSARVENMDWSGVEGPVGEAGRRLGVVSTVASPIVVEDRLWGAMIVSRLNQDRLPLDTEVRLENFTELIGTAIANAQSRETVAGLADEQAALRRVAMLVANDVPSNEIFSAVSEEVARLFDSAAGVGRFEPDPAVVYVGVVNVDIPIGSRWEFQEGMISAAVHRTGRPARVEEGDWPSLEGELGETVRRHGFRSMVGSPIFVEGLLWGTVFVSSQDLLPRDTEERLERFTELIATAIANAETRQARAQLAEEQAALRRVATLVAEGAESAALFSAVAKEVARVLDVALSAVVRYEADDTATHVGSWGWANENPFPVGTSWKLDESSVSGLVAATRLPARVANYEDVPGPLAAAVTREVGIHSAVGAPILVGGHLWGVMMALSTEEKPLPADAEMRLAAFTELIATAISNATARTELIESRARIVAAGDDTRRRIERDLHDGTQQRLVSLALAARAAAAELPAQSHDVEEKLSSIAVGLGAAVEELQEFSRGIHPAILSDAGLGPALEALALRSSIPVKLEVGTKERFAEPVEVAAYFVASESLANAAKHSRASRIDVALTIENKRVLLSVCDDGIGGADPGRGSGLVGLRDRVEALGGTLEVTSKPSGGTSLVAVLPSGSS